jgi:hypothetical protein
LPDGRHLVLFGGGEWHRLWLRIDDPGVPLASLILHDGLVDLRRAAAGRLDSWRGGATGRAPAGFLPTAYQAHRLGTMLAILDLMQGPEGGGVTSHDVARRIIYPGLSVGRGAEWKSSSERRRTQRLIEEARALMQGGYRALLAGPSGRQK